MKQYQRPPHLFIVLKDTQTIDLGSLLSGKFQLDSKPEWKIFSLLTSLETICSIDHLSALAKIPTDRWVSTAEILPEFGGEAEEAELRLAEWAQRGVLLSDEEEPELSRLRRRSHLLDELQWHPHAAFHHANRRGSEHRESADGPTLSELENLFLDNSAKTEAFVEEHGAPPELFLHRESETVVDLPLEEDRGELFSLLKRRKTQRKFVEDRSMPLAEFSSLIRGTFGYSAWSELGPQVRLVHRTSPSGGSRHPIEAYPLVLQVEGLETGVYHYDGENHRLELLRAMGLEEAREIAVRAAEGQAWIATAHVAVFLTARFFKNFWKYRKNYRTYDVILMDAGHLSQTFYLLATSLGLGAFYTGAINAPFIEELLDLEGFEEGALAICGGGVVASGNALAMQHRPFIPRETKI